MLPKDPIRYFQWNMTEHPSELWLDVDEVRKYARNNAMQLLEYLEPPVKKASILNYIIKIV